MRVMTCAAYPADRACARSVNASLAPGSVMMTALFCPGDWKNLSPATSAPPNDRYAGEPTRPAWWLIFADIVPAKTGIR
jgi:hypothetical protein